MTDEAEKAPSREPFLYRWFFFGALPLLVVVYAVQMATPLRLDDDTVDYLRAAAAMTDGTQVPTLPIPLGYSVFLSLMERAGIANSFYFVLQNCLALAIGLYSFWQLEQYSRKARQIAILITLLAVPVIRSVPIALPEAVFFGTSFLAIWLMTAAASAEGARRILLIAAALLLSIFATSLRSIGVVLFPPLIWSSVHQATRTRIDSRIRNERFRAVVPVVLLIVGTIVILASSRIFGAYLTQTRNYYGEGPLLEHLLRRVVVTLSSWGEIVVNLPFSRFREWRVLFVAAGALSAALFLSLIRRPIKITAARLYLIVYLFALVVWPNPAPRLWMAIIPLTAAEVSMLFSSATRPNWLSVAAVAYLVWFALSGVVALGYTTRISLSGERFSQLYGKSGGMADPSIQQGDRSWSRVQLYMREAARMQSRYGGR